MSWDLRPFVGWIHREYEPSVRAGDRAGEYANRPGGRADLYGSGDLACVLHTIGRLRLSEAARLQWAEVFAEYQDPLTGHFAERGRATHVELHVTAYALGALELLGVAPARPLRFADGFRTPRAARAFVETLDWREWVYLESHRGAGLGAVFALAPGLSTPSWFAAWFEALEEHLDPATGMFGDAKPPDGDTDQIGGTFHYAFLYEHANRLLPHPEARIDAVLGLQRPNGIWDPDNPHWLTLDALYLLARAARRTDHRRTAIDRAVAQALDHLLAVVTDDAARESAFGSEMGSHTLVAAISTAAVAQQHLGAQAVVTDQPLRLVLDRRPFI